MRVVRSQKVTFVSKNKAPRNVFFEETEGGLRPEQAIEEGRINTQLSSECLHILRSCLVEVIKDA